jgi:hypothetical protein
VGEVDCSDNTVAMLDISEGFLIDFVSAIFDWGRAKALVGVGAGSGVRILGLARPLDSLGGLTRL